MANTLRSAIKMPLTKQDLEKGFVYMFWDQRNFGMVKIGRTVNLQQRLKQWKRQCKVTHHYHHAQESSMQMAPHVSHIEKLIHIELYNFRKKRRCDGCGRTHREWFEVSAVKVQRVFQKWKEWILRSPYSMNDEGEWVVNAELDDTLSRVCQPINLSDDKVIRAPHRAQRGSPEPRKSMRLIKEA